MALGTTGPYPKLMDYDGFLGEAISFAHRWAVKDPIPRAAFDELNAGLAAYLACQQHAPKGEYEVGPKLKTAIETYATAVHHPAVVNATANILQLYHYTMSAGEGKNVHHMDAKDLKHEV